MNILIVEDSATLRAHMSKLVTELNHRPLFAKSGVEALQLIGSCDFDLVIMDVEMPGLDGFETTSLMREALGDRWVPIIYSTSHNSDDKVLAGIEAGGDDYLVKPVSHNLLKAKLTSMQRIAEMHQQLRRLNDELSERSQLDGLTHLLNRRTFTEKAEQCLHDTRRFGKGCAMLLIDVDFFKQYNDHYGHQQGDECLRTLALALSNNVNRDCDLVGRYGGEEFIILLPDTDLKGATDIAEGILKAVDNLNIPHKLSSVADHITLSIGVDEASKDDRYSLEALISVADKNLYLAKNNGRHQVNSSNQAHKTLLIVDPSEVKLAALTQHLKLLGNIITADSANECLEMAKDIKPDLIIAGSQKASADLFADLDHQIANHVRTACIPIFYIDEMSEDTIQKIRKLLQ
ncbi:MAG: diguanylate cyclase [Ketobacter sp.]